MGATLRTIVPKDAQALSRRLWLRGAKRLGILAFDAEQISEHAAAADAASPPADGPPLEAPPTLFGASLYRAEPLHSPLTPASSPPGAAAGAAPAHGGLALPTASYWAFGRQAFETPERLQARPRRAKNFRLALVFTRPISPPSMRTAHGQAFLEFAKWEIARLITEAIPKFEVTYLVQTSADSEAWEHYDVVLRSRKPELVHFLTGATTDEQMALATTSDAVLTDHAQLGAAVLGHGRRAVILGAGEQAAASLSFGGSFLNDWSFDRPALERLIHPPPKGKPGTPECLEVLQTSITRELASGGRWFEA